jgi:HPt (histidine-containing phosphotransfer) domain-containing protein
MTQPINIVELLERVSGNKPFVITMLDKFFQTSDDRLLTLRNEFISHNYEELAEQAHKLKGLVGNLSINQALNVLRELHDESLLRNDTAIARLLVDLEAIIADAKQFYRQNPTLIL